MSSLSFAGRVAIVTGAGGALGRAYALLLASRGCSVLVNDLGVPMAGSGVSHGPADAVVAEIRAAGGKAAANFDNVLEGDKIVEAAIKEFGRIDIVINNAGILRDVSFLKMTQQQWSANTTRDIIQQVHQDGAFKVTKAAWPHMLKQKYGRIIMTSSASGLYGSGGQANYSAAKLALVGFASSLAKEGQRNNVLCNTIAPIAGSRMTETVMPPDMVAALDPKFVAPVVAYLCHESSTTNGAVFESGAGFVAQVHWQRSAGVHFPLSPAGSFTPEAIASRWAEVNDFDKGATYPAGLQDTMAVIMGQLGSKTETNLGKGKPQLAARATNGGAAASSSAAPAFKSDAIFAELSAGIKANPEIAQKVNAIFCYNLTDAQGAKKTYTVNLKKADTTTERVYAEVPRDGKKADVTIDVADQDYVDLAAGKASAQLLYMKGRLKMKGNMATAMKFDALIKASKQPKAKL